MLYTPPPLWTPEPFVITTMNTLCMGEIMKSNGQTVATGAWPVANKAFYFPFRITRPHTYTRALWSVGTVVGGQSNVDVGIYDMAGARLASTGAVASGASNTLGSAVLTASVTLAPGTYYLAMSSSDVDGMMRGGPNAESIRFAGARSQVTAHPLPATATFAAYGTTGYIPVFGISELAYA
jgi:hypothetical protein